MTPRKRTNSGEKLPDNLYKNGDYYRYKHPKTGKWFGMGTNKENAIEDAKKANALLAQKTDMLRKIMNGDLDTWAELIKRYIAERQLDEAKKESTTKEENYRLQHIARDLGNKDLKSTTQRLISDYLSNNYKGNAYNKHRGTLIKLFKFGIATGMFPDGFPNLGESTLTYIEPPKLRMALQYEHYTAIWEQAEPWLQVAMDFALATLQRRSDVIKVKYSDIKNNELYVIQNKTEKHGERAFLRIKIGSYLEEIISRSRAIPPLCPFILHRAPNRHTEFENQEHWAQIRDQYLTKAFNAARDKTGLFKGCAPGEAPTFHEIRALGGALYLRQGFTKEYVNLLMGHTTQRMTDSYTEQLINWTECEAGLQLTKSQ